LIAFLPHIYDSSKDERNSYISTLLEVAKSLKNKPVNFLWTQGGDNYEFEEAF
jgi:protein disulfide-isomerase A6